MIVLDIESSGMDTGRCGIWQIGAFEYENPENKFLDEARIDDEDIIEESALKVIGKTEEELRDPKKQSQKQLIENFLNWTKTCKERIILGHNILWDITFIRNKCSKYGLLDEFKIIGLRSIDLHTFANLMYLKEYDKFKLENERSAMSLNEVIKFCGFEDNRIEVKNGKITKQGKPHNAFEDCQLEAKCFEVLMKKFK